MHLCVLQRLTQSVLQLASEELKVAFIFHFCLIRLISAGINRPIMNIERAPCRLDGDADAEASTGKAGVEECPQRDICKQGGREWEVLSYDYWICWRVAWSLALPPPSSRHTAEAIASASVPAQGYAEWGVGPVKIHSPVWQQKILYSSPLSSGETNPTTAFQHQKCLKLQHGCFCHIGGIWNGHQSHSSNCCHDTAG